MATAIKDLNLISSGKSILTTRYERKAQQIRNIVLTTCAIPDRGIYGEVYGLPEYGCTAAINLWEHIITNNTSDVIRSIYNACKNITDIEVFLNDIEVYVNEIEQRANIVLYYRDILTNEQQRVDI